MATASQSLLNMTVAADNGTANQGLLMPKLQFRFRVQFFNLGVDVDSGLELTKQVIDCARPTVDFAQIDIPVYNSTLKVAGKHSWNDISINVRDDSSGTVTRAVGQQLQKQLDFVEQASAASAQDYKFQTNIEILDGGNGALTPVVLETWELYGCFLKQANYNSLNYGTNEAVTIALSLAYDNAIQSRNGTLEGVGEFVNAQRNVNGLTTGIGSAL